MSDKNNTIYDKCYDWVKDKYFQKGLKWSRMDNIHWSIVFHFIMPMAMIVLAIYIYSLLFIKIGLVRYGFERTIIFMLILLTFRLENWYKSIKKELKNNSPY